MNDSGGGRALFQSLRVPFDLKAVFVAFLGLVVLWVVGLGLGSFYKSQYIGERVDVERDRITEAKGDPDSAPNQKRIGEMRDELSKGIEVNGTQLVLKRFFDLFIPDSFLTFFRGLGLFRFEGAVKGAPIELGNWSFGFGFAVVFLVYALFGGAICRIVASRIARDESIGVREALTFSFGSWRDYVLAPVFVFVAILFFYWCNALAGLVTSIPWIGPVLGVALLPLVALSSLIIVLIAFGGILGLGLMIAAIAVERNGSLDAISRAFSYIYARPVQFFFYMALVLFFAGIITTVGGQWLDVTSESFHAGTWEHSEAEQAVEQNAVHSRRQVMSPKLDGLEKFQGLTGIAVFVFTTLLFWGVKATALFYLIGGTTSIYFLLRREVDGTEESEIYLTDADEDELDFSVTDAATPAAVDAPKPAPAAEPETPDAPDEPEEPETESSKPAAKPKKKGKKAESPPAGEDEGSAEVGGSAEDGSDEDADENG